MKGVISILVMLMVVSGIDIHAKSYYNTVQNNFGGLFPHPGMRMQGRYKAIDEDRLVEENATLATALTIDTMRVISTAYRYQVRLANLNNRQGKTKSIKNPITGESTTITSPQWGVVFNKDNSGHYLAVVLSCDNSAPLNDIADQRSMRVTLVQNDGSNAIELASATLTRGVSLEDDLNTVCVDVSSNNVRVAIGKDELIPVLETAVARPAGSVKVGYLVGAGSRVSIERAVLTVEGEQQAARTTLWTVDALDEYLTSSIDPVEGYWRYLDRDMEDKWLRLGGRYTLAIVRADDGYDLIYLDGAQVHKSQWQPCMLKGHITKTQFTGNYDLKWIDATMEPIDEDCYATIENGILLTLNFPIYKSQVRFSKVLERN